MSANAHLLDLVLTDTPEFAGFEAEIGRIHKDQHFRMVAAPLP